MRDGAGDLGVDQVPLRNGLLTRVFIARDIKPAHVAEIVAVMIGLS